MECPSCRKAIPDGDPFCAYCGQPLRAQQVALATPPPSRRPASLPLLLGAGAAVPVLAGLLWFALHWRQTTPPPPAPVVASAPSNPAPALPAGAAPAAGAPDQPAAGPPTSSQPPGDQPAALSPDQPPDPSPDQPPDPSPDPSPDPPPDPSPDPPPDPSPDPPAGTALPNLGNWLIAGSGALDYSFEFAETLQRAGQTELVLGHNDPAGMATLYFLRWSDDALRLVKKASHSGTLLALATGDMLNHGKDQVVAVLADTLWIFDENLAPVEIPNPGYQRLVVGSFLGTGQVESMVLQAGDDALAYNLYRFTVGTPPKLVAGDTGNVSRDFDFRRGVVDPSGRMTFASFAKGDEASRVTLWAWEKGGFHSWLDVPAPRPALCYSAFSAGGRQYLAFALADGTLALNRLGDQNFFALVDIIGLNFGGNWCVAGGSFSGNGLELLAYDRDHARYALLRRKG